MQKIYRSNDDRRSMMLNTTAEYREHWAELNAIAQKHPHLAAPHVETHCREAVMWWTHHLTNDKRDELRATNITVPLLPENEKKPCNGESKDEKHLCVSLEVPNSCDWCHSTQAKHDAGVPGTTPPNALNPKYHGPDDGNPHGWDRKRRCDQDQMPRCQLCEGVGGHAYGDANDQIDMVDCEVVANASDVDNSTVHWPLYPKAFTISKVDGRPGYADTLIGWKTDPFCFSFFPQNDSHGELCYRSQDGVAKYYDIANERTRTDYNVQLTGPFSHFPNISSSIMQVDWQMWIQNHLWVVDQCVCANPSGQHCTNEKPCYSYVWHWDTFKTAQYLGRENIGVEWLDNAGVGKNSKMMELDHFIMWTHHAWTDPKSGRIVRMWKPFNGLQNYDPESWTDSIQDPSVFESPPPKCNKGGAKVRINCDDDGNFDGKTVEGMEHLKALADVALEAKDFHTLDMIKLQYEAALLMAGQ